MRHASGSAAALGPDQTAADGFAALQELSRHGYATDPQSPPDDRAVRVRRPASPDLLVYPDGTIRVPEGQRSVSGHSPQPVVRRFSWRRGLLFLFALALYTAISAVILINLIAD